MLPPKSSDQAGPLLAAFLAPRFECCPLGSGAALFDRHRWASHVLSPATVAVLETLAEVQPLQPLSLSQAQTILQRSLFADEADLDAESLDMMANILRQLRHIGVLA